jgi:DNA repair protein RadC
MKMIINYRNKRNIDLLKLMINEENNVGVEEEILNRFGDNIAEILLHSTEVELTAIKGIGPKKAAQIIAFREIVRRLYEVNSVDNTKITCPKDVFDLVKGNLMHEEVEHFQILILDTKNKVKNIENISTGSLNSSIVHPREVFNTAIRRRAANIIAVHNHPSGDTKPSREDISITERLEKAGEMVGIKLLDHIIVGNCSYLSFKEEGII